MTDRERWVVYPLLFLSIGLAMHNDIEMQAYPRADDGSTLRCKTLEIVGPPGKPTVQISSTTEGDGLIETFDAQGNHLSRISPNATGATLELYDREGETCALVGYETKLVGLFAGKTDSDFTHPLLAVPKQDLALDRKHLPADDRGAAPQSKSDSGTKSDSATKSGATRATKPPAQAPAAADNPQQKQSEPAAK